MASRQGHTKIVQLLLDNQADVNDRTTSNSSTPLHFAAYHSRTCVVNIQSTPTPSPQFSFSSTVPSDATLCTTILIELRHATGVER